MIRRPSTATATLVALLAFAGACSKGSPSAAPGGTVAGSVPLRIVKDVELPGGSTRLDYQDLDSTTHRLYVAHLGDSTIHVIDTDRLTVAATIDGISDVHGVRLDPDDHRLYASATGTNEVVGIDTATNQIVSRTPAGEYPDGIAYDPTDHKLYISNERGTAETVVDAHSGQRTATIPIGGNAGNTAYDTMSGLVLVNVQDQGHIAIIDPATDTVTATIPTPGCDSNHGLYIDSESALAFVACESNAKLLVIDLDTKAVAATFAIGDNPDVLAFDPAVHRLYIAAESGTLDIFDEHDRSLTKATETKIADTAHTVAVDPSDHRLFLPLENVDGHPTVRVLEQ